MFDRILLRKETYQQRGNYCVLASYGVAMKCFLGETCDIADFFRGYCEEMELGCKSSGVSQALHEELYFLDFCAKTKALPGYDLFEKLHRRSDVSPFKDARAVAIVEHLYPPEDYATIEAKLKSQETSLAMLFVNQLVPVVSDQAITHLIKPNHSITVGHDQHGFYAYDVNRKAIANAPSIVDLGQSLLFLGPGDCLLFTRIPKPTQL